MLDFYHNLLYEQKASSIMAEFLENEIQENNLVWNSITYKGIIVKCKLKTYSL